MENFFNKGNYEIQKDKQLKMKILSNLNENDKNEYFIYFSKKDEDDDEEGEDNENEGNCLKEQDLKIRIFGEIFVKNNKDNCRIIINGKEEELTEFYTNKDNEEIIKVKKKKKKKISDMSHMFNGCDSLIYLPKCMGKWDMNNVNNINYMFNGLTELLSFPDI